jgi:hypothetical protein
VRVLGGPCEWNSEVSRVLEVEVGQVSEGVREGASEDRGRAHGGTGGALATGKEGNGVLRQTAA